MATESLNENGDAFDEVTLEKLDIYARYLQGWLAASLNGRMRIERAGIYDLSCDRGATADGSDSSLLRAVSALRASESNIMGCTHADVRLVFNDADPARGKALARRLGPQVLSDDGRRLANIHYYCEPLGDLLQSILPKLRSTRTKNLLFIDEFGLNECDEERLKELHTLKHTDVLVSVSSNWFRRFADSREAEFWGVDRADLESANYNHIHRFMSSYFRTLIGKRFFLAPFSLNRQSRIYGLIFASCDIPGLERFLEAAWHKDPYTDVTNFDLYDDTVSRLRLALVNAHKILDFQKELMACLQSGKFASDREIYLYALQRGFLARHAADTVKAFCNLRNVRFRTRAGKAARPRLSRGGLKRPRPIIYN